MEIVAIKFTQPRHVSGFGTYREGEIAGFSRQLADRIVEKGAGVYWKKEAKAAAKPPVEEKEEKEVTPAPRRGNKGYQTK